MCFIFYYFAIFFAKKVLYKTFANGIKNFERLLVSTREVFIMPERKAKKIKKVRSIAGILYEDSAPPDWKERIADLHMMALVSPKHDSDVTATGEHKKDHYHVMLIFDGPKEVNSAKEVLYKVGCINYTEEIHSVNSYARYLCHIDDHDKHRYNTKDVLAFGGADYELFCQRSLDKDSAVTEMEDYIDAHHVYSFRSFSRYCRANEPTWHRHLTTDCGWYIREYIKSAWWEECTPEGIEAQRLEKQYEKID